MPYVATKESPLGPLTLHFNADGALVALKWGKVGAKELQAREHVKSAAALVKVERWLEAYFDKRFVPMDFTVAPQGTPYQEKVWKALMEVPCGYTASYKDIAEVIKSGPRAVGNANGKNPLPLIVPCHRIVAADGTIGGYSGGTKKLPAIKLKEWLLVHEGAR